MAFGSRFFGSLLVEMGVGIYIFDGFKYSVYYIY